MTKTFELATVLTVTTGRLLTDMGKLYDILNFMTGDDLMTHQLPRASNVCAPELLRQFPKLTSVEVPEHFDATDLKKSVDDWLAKLKPTYGNEFTVQPVDDWEHKNPLTELAEMAPDKPIIVVQ